MTTSPTSSPAGKTPPSSELTTRSPGRRSSGSSMKSSSGKALFIARQHGALPRGLDHHRNAAGAVGQQHHAPRCVVRHRQCARPAPARPFTAQPSTSPSRAPTFNSTELRKGDPLSAMTTPVTCVSCGSSRTWFRSSNSALRCSSCKRRFAPCAHLLQFAAKLLVLFHDPRIRAEIIQQGGHLCQRCQSPVERRHDRVDHGHAEAFDARAVDPPDKEHRQQRNDQHAHENASQRGGHSRCLSDVRRPRPTPTCQLS